MSFRGNERRKTTLPSDLKIFDRSTPIELQIKIISDGHSTANFERLYYKNCPVLDTPSRRVKLPKTQPILEDMNRRTLVYKITSVVNGMDRTVRSKINIFTQLVEFFRYCDKHKHNEIFTTESIKQYTKSLVKSYHSGAKGKSLRQKQSVLKTFLKEFDPNLYFCCCQYFYEFPNDGITISPYTDEEIKILLESLYVIYKDYSKYTKQRQKPLVFPLKGDSQHTKHQINSRKVHANTNKDQWKFDLSRAAYFITCFYTGVNANSLFSLKHSDVSKISFKETTRGVYKFSTVKGRQGGRTNHINVGFGRKAKDFLTDWIKISRLLTNSKSEYVFPKIINGKSYQMTVTEASHLSKVFQNLNLPSLSSQRFRKTKSSLTIRATGSLLMVSEGLNNSPITASKNYSDGDPTTIELTLAKALDIRRLTAQGKSLNEATEHSAYKFRDPIRESQLLSQERIPTSSSSGLRCTMPYGQKAKNLKKALIYNEVATKDDNVACYKFLECFSCEFHAVIAEEQDIWLMLSFNDIILQSLARPSVNSIPSNLLSNVNASINNILEKIKCLHPNVYKLAYEKYLDGPHPLWSDNDDLDLLLRLYK
ncbi:MAG: site-specific integrase [Vreelandella alkaliphila]|uniref:site-specific integrase n=1 Tax=Halomonadaceae TaxID=28256 RepID=UPI0018665D63|nr:site-specific integrase [Halomonas sp. 3A7M]